MVFWAVFSTDVLVLLLVVDTCQLEGPSLPFIPACILGRYPRPDKAIQTERNGGGGGEERGVLLGPLRGGAGHSEECC